MSRTTPTRNQALAAAGALFAIVVALVAQNPVDGRASAAPAKAAKSVTLVSRTFHLTQPDQKERLVVLCPRGTTPFGGGMTSDPPPGPDGEGVYPHSYERLGVQRGWHVTAVLFDQTGGSTQPRDVTLQVMCGRKLGHVTPPHKTEYVHPGQTKKIVVKCPGRRHLFAGGFQRTDFVSRGGNFATTARMVSPKAWRVVGHAFGGFGGELTAIAYCVRSKRPLLREVSSSTLLAPGGFGTATTPTCPGGRRLTSGGFGTPDGGRAFFADGRLNADGSWSASGFNRSDQPVNVTAYGYCLKL